MGMETGLSHVLFGSSRKPLIVFLHGFMGSKNDWTDVSSTLEDQFHLMSVDLPGHGESPFPNEPGYGVAELCADLIEVIDETGHGTFSLVGYSMGGRIALYLATIYAMRIDALVLESASPGIQDDEERHTRRATDESVANQLETGDFEAFLRDWYKQPLFQSLHRAPHLIEAAMESKRGGDPGGLARALRAFGPGTVPSVWGDLPAHRIPTLLITGDSDSKYCDIARLMTQRCGHMEHRRMAEAGHNVHLEQPSQYTDELRRFLQTHLE
ncbi:MAG: alpha/beta hydrolase [Candidatus Hydrogenedentota bacterium]